MMMAIQAKGALLGMIGRLAEDMPAEFETGFWADVVDPIATMIVRVRGALTEEERMLLIAVAAKALKAASEEQEALNEAAAVIHRAGGAA